MGINSSERIYSICVRTNRRVQWRYADYCGRWETPEKALEVAKERMGDKPFEYQIEEIGEGIIKTGFVNWNK